MTITEDASQPGPVQITGTSGSSGPFSPPAGLLVALVAVDGPLTNTQQNSNVVSDSGTHTWVRKARGNTFVSSALSGAAEVWECQLTSPPGSITVSTAWTGANGGELVVRVLNGAAADQSTAATNTAGGTSIAPTVALTPTQIGSHVYGAALDWTTNAVLTPNGNTTSIGQFNDSTDGDTWAAWSAAADTASLVSTTFGYTNANAAYNLAAAEILPAASSDATGPQRLPAHLLIELAGRRAILLATGAATPQAFTQNLAGTITPAGSPAKAVTKPGLAGSATGTGALAKQANKSLVGSVTPAGVLTTVKVVLRAFAGAIAPAGALAKLVGKPLAGTSAPAGALAKQDQKSLSGVVAPNGSIAKLALKALAGAVAPAGALTTVRVILRNFAGAITAAGTVTRHAGKGLAGAVTGSGSVRKAAARALVGAMAPAGALAKLLSRAFAGVITSTGTDTNAIIGPDTSVAGTMSNTTTVPRLGPVTAGPALADSSAGDRLANSTAGPRIAPTTSGGDT